MNIPVPTPPSTPIQRSPEFSGPPAKLDPVRDMEPIRMGDLTSFHRGLHVMIAMHKRPEMYGRITALEHDDLMTEVRVRWNGEYDKRRADPEQVIRIEVTA